MLLRSEFPVLAFIFALQYTKGEIERALAALQMAEHTHLLYVDSVADAVARLYDLSADLGIKPYKSVILYFFR